MRISKGSSAGLRAGEKDTTGRISVKSNAPAGDAGSFGILDKHSDIS